MPGLVSWLVYFFFSVSWFLPSLLFYSSPFLCSPPSSPFLSFSFPLSYQKYQMICWIIIFNWLPYTCCIGNGRVYVKTKHLNNADVGSQISPGLSQALSRWQWESLVKDPCSRHFSCMGWDSLNCCVAEATGMWSCVTTETCVSSTVCDYLTVFAKHTVFVH